MIQSQGNLHAAFSALGRGTPLRGTPLAVAADDESAQMLGRLGVVPRAIQEILLALEQRRQLSSRFTGGTSHQQPPMSLEATLTMSYVELYGNEIHDLLNGGKHGG